MDMWDPMAADYNDKNFNRYDEGVGRDLQDSRGRSSGAKLFVRNLPKGLGEEGLYNLFAEYGAVEEARLVKQSDKDVDIGFVTMRTAVEGERAISKLHKKKLGKATLKVEVALTNEEKDHRRQIKEREREMMGSLRKSFDWDDNKSVTSDHSVKSHRDGTGRPNGPPPGGRGRGNISGMESGVFGYPTPLMNFGRGNFHPLMPLGNLGPMPFLPGLGGADGRFGGGGLIPTPGFGRGGLIPTPGMPGPMFPMREQMMPRQLEAPKRAPFIDIQVPENPRLENMKCCTLCRKDGCKLLCSACRLYYCSVECQRKDWPNHKDICAAFREYYKMKGTPEVSKQHQKENGKLSGESDSDVRKKDAEKRYHKKSGPGGRNENDQWNSQDETRKPRPGVPQRGNASTHQSAAQPQGDGRARRAPKPLNKSEGAGDKDQKRTNGKNQLDSEADDKQKDGAQAIPGGAGDASSPGHILMTIPVGSSGKAYLTHFESPYKFWISLVDHLEEFTETTVLISKQRDCSPPSTPKPKDTYGALWEGEWARLEIVSVSGEEATVFFMDYGNTGVIKIKELRPLTLDIVKLPAQALCCCVSKIKPKGNVWSEAAVSRVSEWFGPPMSQYFNFEIVAKRGSRNAVKISIDNEALSEMLLSNDLGERDAGEPGLPSLTSAPQQGNKPARFTVKELKRGLDGVNAGDRLTTLLLSAQRMDKIIAVKESAAETLLEVETLMALEGFAQQPTYRAMAGDVVAAIFSEDQKWYRAHVLSAAGDTCSLFFVDYGNAEDQKMENIREIKNDKLKAIPAQALTCSLHGLDKIHTSVTQDEIEAEFSQLLPSYQVDETWTLLSVKAKKDNSFVVDVVSSQGLSLAENLRKKFPPAEPNKAQASPVIKETIGSPSSKTSSNNSPSAAITSKSVISQKRPVSIEGERLPINPDRTVPVMVTYIQDCGQFYVRISSNEQKFQAMSAKLNKSVKSRPKFEDPPSEDGVAMVQFSMDKLWYRGRVLSVEPTIGGICKVMFVDYGNSESVRWADLRELEPAACHLPAQAIRCCLAGELEKLNQKSHREFKQYLENETVDVRVVGGNVDSLAVEMFAHGKDINSFVFGTDSQTSSKSPARKIENLRLKPGQATKVECVNLMSPAGFYVQVTSQVPATIQLTQDLTTRLAQAPEPKSSVAVGDFVATKFSEDSDVIWYRGRVDKIQGDKALVYFVDFGNFEEREKAGLMCLSEKDCSVPAATLKCQLQGCKQSSPETDAKFSTEGQSQIESLTVISQNEHGCVVDILNSKGQSITSMFYQAQKDSPVKSPGQSKPSPSVASPVHPSIVTAPAHPSTVTSPASSPYKTLPTESLGEVNSLMDAVVPEIKSFSSIFVTSTDATQQTNLLQLMVALNESAETLPVLTEATLGSLCAARFSEDGNWYRARVTTMVSPTLREVQFVDYGNSEQTQVSQLKAISGDPQFTQLPAQAVQCCLVGFEREVGASSRELTESEKTEVARLKTEVLGKPVRVKLVGRVGEINVVDIENEKGHFLSQMFKNPSHSKPSPPVTSPTGPSAVTSPGRPSTVTSPAPCPHKTLPTESLGEVNSLTDAVVPEIKSFSSIFVTSADATLQTNLLQLMVALNESAETLPVLTEATLGSLCAARFSEDGNWYRARVTTMVSPTLCEVQFVDYGNSEQTQISQLKAISGDPQFTQLPAQAVQCCLVGFEREVGASSRELTESEKTDVARLKTEVLEKPVRVKLVGRVGEINVVDIENEKGQFLSQMFKSPAPATNTPMLSDLVHEKPSEKQFDVILLQMTSLDDFYCQRCNEEEMTELALLGELLESDVSQLSTDATVSPVVGGLYASKFQDAWYRAVVEKIIGSQVLIKYIDFGNSEEKPFSELRPLNRKRLALPVRILKCKLHGVKPVFPDWVHPDMPVYLSMMSDKKLQLEICGEEEDGTMLVSLLVSDGQEWLDVGQDLVRIGWATQSAAEAATPQVQATGDDGEEEDEMELAKKIEQLQKMLEETKLKKKTKVTNK